MEHEPLLGILAEGVQPLGVLDRAQGDRGQALGLAPGEEGRAVGPGERADLDRDGPDLVEPPSVGPLSLVEDEVADELLLEGVEDLLGLLGLFRLVGRDCEARRVSRTFLTAASLWSLSLIWMASRRTAEISCLDPGLPARGSGPWA